MRLITAGALILIATGATAQHPAKDHALHDAFYSHWMKPDNQFQSCCNKLDCYPTQFKREGIRWYALRREDAAWVFVPAIKFEHNRTTGIPRESPDEGSHVCMQPPGLSDAVFCAVLGIGG